MVDGVPNIYELLFVYLLLNLLLLFFEKFKLKYGSFFTDFVNVCDNILLFLLLSILCDWFNIKLLFYVYSLIFFDLFKLLRTIFVKNVFLLNKFFLIFWILTSIFDLFIELSNFSVFDLLNSLFSFIIWSFYLFLIFKKFAIIYYIYNIKYSIYKIYVFIFVISMIL